MAELHEEHLALYAVRSGDATVREHPEPDDPLRSPFELDRHRIIECTAFRRLEGKTQVFLAAHHDHFRTRLTHTLEAAQIARCLAAALGANEGLAEAITLAHDLGHPPFGHAGEAALDEAMRAHGGFNHNLHALRVVEFLEHPFPPFRGLNLTAETRAGLATHATRYDTPDQARAAGFSPRGVPVPGERPARDTPNVQAGPSVEAQIASVADRMAYNCHDLEDGIGAEFVALDQLASVQLWQDAHEKATHDHPGAQIHAIRRVVLDALLNALLSDVIVTSKGLLANVRTSQEVKAAPMPLVRFSDTVDAQLADLEAFLLERVYKHSEVIEMDASGRETIAALFAAYRAAPAMMPARFAGRIDDQGLDRVICDYIAGMTDRYCAREHARVVARSPDFSA